MFINRLHFRDVKPLNLDIPEEGSELPLPARKRLLIQGGNGSGKTTLLDTIASLWQFWGEWIDVRDGKSPPKYQLKHFLTKDGNRDAVSIVGAEKPVASSFRSPFPSLGD